MDERRLTVFPAANHRDRSPSTKTNPKRKFESGESPRNLKLCTSPSSSIALIEAVKHRDPGEFYSIIYIRDRKDCLAIGKGAGSQVVLIKRTPIQEPFRPTKLPNVLNLVDAYIYKDSMFTVSDRPGVSLKDIASSRSLGVVAIATLSKEV
jgi:hypothetical protein